MPEVVKEVSAEDEFSKAFTDLSKLSDEPDSAIKTKPDPAAPAAGDAKAAEAAAAAAAGDAAVDAAAKAAEDKAAADKAAADKAAADAAAADDGKGALPTPEEQIAADEAARAAAQGDKGQKKDDEPDRLTTALEKFAERLGNARAEPAKPAPTPKPTPPLFTEQEVPVIQNYLKEFPDIAKAEELIRRVEQRQLSAYIFAEVDKAFAARLNPIAEVVDQLAGRTFKQDLTTAVPDYTEMTRDKVIAWVDKQPPYLQAAYKTVVEEGTVEEVADLIKRYKADVGETSTSAAPAKPAQTELPAPTKKAVAALTPVGSKRTATASTGPSKDDYDGAFKEAAAAET